MKHGRRAKLERPRKVVRKDDQGTRRESEQRPKPARRPSDSVEKSIEKKRPPWLRSGPWGLRMPPRQFDADSP